MVDWYGDLGEYVGLMLFDDLFFEMVNDYGFEGDFVLEMSLVMDIYDVEFDVGIDMFIDMIFDVSDGYLEY